jgi:hypothetical protein
MKAWQHSLNMCSNWPTYGQVQGKPSHALKAQQPVKKHS